MGAEHAAPLYMPDNTARSRRNHRNDSQALCQGRDSPNIVDIPRRQSPRGPQVVTFHQGIVEHRPSATSVAGGPDTIPEY